MSTQADLFRQAGPAEHGFPADAGGRPLPAWELVRSKRRTLAIHIRQDGHVQVRAPLRLPRRDIEDFVASRADWIHRHLDEIAARGPRPQWHEGWGDGRSWWHEGEALPVRCLAPGQRLPGVSLRTRVALHDGGLWVSAALAGDSAAIADALLRWQSARAAEVLPASVDALVARFGEDWRPSDLRLRHMRSRWGSCSRDGRMTLSTQLMHVPPACRDYVICHEMSHLREFNHGPRFYAWQEHLCPDWRARRDDMKQWAERLRGG